MRAEVPAHEILMLERQICYICYNEEAGAGYT